MKAATLLTIAVLFAVLPIYPQDVSDQADVPPPNPPARVARLNWISGDVSFRPGSLDEWADATVNYPLTTRDQLVTGDSSRAEMHIGLIALRLDSHSNFGFVNLDDSIVQVSLTEGSLEIRLRQLNDDDSFEIDTPNGAITLLRTGDYRIDTDPGRDATMLTVLTGQADFLTADGAGGKSAIVRAGQTLYLQQGGTPDIRSANDADEFDAFTLSRNNAENAIPPVTYVPVSMNGAQDLAVNGTWEENPDYGPVWLPPVGPDWAPYSNGRWVFEDPWGWTWIDDAPWGFAPFHYGRWLFGGGRWFWVPDHGPIVYEPALVVFVDNGVNVSWFPAGPRDPWTPAWRNRTKIDGNARFANRYTPGAVMTMSRIDFAAAHRVNPRMYSGSEGRITGGAPPVTPVRESRFPGTVRMRPPVNDRPVVVRKQPPSVPLPRPPRGASQPVVQPVGQPTPSRPSGFRPVEPQTAKPAEPVSAPPANPARNSPGPPATRQPAPASGRGPQSPPSPPPAPAPSQTPSPPQPQQPAAPARPGVPPRPLPSGDAGGRNAGPPAQIRVPVPDKPADKPAQ